MSHGRFTTYQASSEEHDRNGNVLQILSSPFLSPSTQVLQEDIRSAVGKDGCRLDKFTTWSARLARLQVPCPAILGKATHVTTQHHQAVPEEDAALDEMGQTAEDTASFL